MSNVVAIYLHIFKILSCHSVLITGIASALHFCWNETTRYVCMVERLPYLSGTIHHKIPPPSLRSSCGYVVLGGSDSIMYLVACAVAFHFMKASLFVALCLWYTAFAAGKSAGAADVALSSDWSSLSTSSCPLLRFSERHLCPSPSKA